MGLAEVGGRKAEVGLRSRKKKKKISIPKHNHETVTAPFRNRPAS